MSPPVVWAITLVMLAVTLIVVLARSRRGEIAIPAPVPWALLGLFVLPAFQLLPLPAILHRLVAPGSAALWHPADPTVAAVLGSGWRPVSIHPGATRGWLAFAVGLTSLIFLAAPALRDRRRALAATLAVVLSGTAVALFGVIARTVFGPLLYGSVAVPTVSPFGPFVSKNHFAGYVEMTTLLALGLAFGLADTARRQAGGRSFMQTPFGGRVVFAAGAAAAMALAVLVSLSRGGVVSLLAGGLAFAGLRLAVRRQARGHRRRMLLIAATIILLLGIVVAVLPLEAVQRVLSLGGIARDPAGAFRVGLWQDTLRLSARSPFVGFGLGSYADALPIASTAPLDMRAEHAENDYLELLAEGGFAGLLLALAIIGYGARQLVSGLARQEDRLLRGLGLGAGAAMTALLVHSAFDFNLRIPSNALVFAFLASLVLAATTSDRAVPRAAFRWAAVALAVLLLVQARPPSRAERASQLEPVESLLDGAGSLRLRWAQAEVALLSRLRHRPAEAEGWVLLGWVRALQGDRKAGVALARYGSLLDRHRVSLRLEADRLARLAQPRE